MGLINKIWDKLNSEAIIPIFFAAGFFKLAFTTNDTITAMIAFPCAIGCVWAITKID